MAKHTDPGPLDLNVLYAEFLLKNKREELGEQYRKKVEEVEAALAERATRLTVIANTGEKPPCAGKLNRLSRELFYAAFKLEQQDT